MPLRQPPVSPLPDDLSFTDRTVIVTGSSAGIGLELSRQFLQRGASTVILAVRNTDKGEAVRSERLSDQFIRRTNPNACVTVMRLDTESYASIHQFAKDFRDRHDSLDILMLNAGIGPQQREMAVDGHEKTVQVNFLSNVLLFLELLPVLEATSTTTGRPSRVTITGSRAYVAASIPKADPNPIHSIVEYLDTLEKWKPFAHYGDTKLLVVLFLNELSERYDPGKVIVNQFCPGMTNTGMSDVLPIYFRIPVDLYKAMHARSVEVAGWIGLHAASVSGMETHGQLLGDKEIERPNEFIQSSKGQALKTRLWKETIREMKALTTLPSWTES